MVKNSSLCFVKAQMLQFELAGQTLGHSLNPLTNFQERIPFGGDGSYSMAVYHKTNWDTIPKVLSEQLITPARRAKDEQGYPKQYPIAAVHKKLWISDLMGRQAPQDLCKKSVIWSASR